MIIYKVTNLLSGKVYIGQTVRKLNVRWRCHCYTKNDTYLGRAIKRYGRENFTIEQIDSASNREELSAKEIQWIAHYNSRDKKFGYNLASGGEKYQHSEATLEKMRASAKKRVMPPQTDAHKEAISKANKGRKGKPVSEETKKKLSEINKGKKPVSYPDTYAKIAASKRSKPMSESHKQSLRDAWQRRKNKLTGDKK